MSQQNSQLPSIASNNGRCLVLLMVIGVFLSVPVPSFMNVASNSRQLPAKEYVSSINKGQQAYFA